MAEATQVEVKGPVEGRFAEVLTPAALDFLAALQRRFNPTRQELLANRVERQARFDAGENPDFLPETKAIRDDPSWRVAPVPADLQDRRVEITGPTDRRMVINALNSGARVFMADFEDANTPTWENMVDGQVNLIDAVRRDASASSAEDGRVYELNDADRDAAGAPARLAPGRDARRSSTASRSPAASSTSASTSSTTPRSCSRAAAAPTSTCRSWRATWKRASGTTSSRSPRSASACRTARSRRRC